MRKYDIFGRKISQIKAFYYLFFIFIFLVVGYLLVTNIQNNRYQDLVQEERVIQRQINTLLQNTNQVTYHEIGEIIQYLPNTFDQNKVHRELEYVRNLSGLSLASNYQVSYQLDAATPFTHSLPSTIKFISMSVTFQTDSPDLILDYIDNIYGQDTLYYISQMNVSYQIEGVVSVSVLIYTFYNDVILT